MGRPQPECPVHPRREQLYPFANRLLGLVPPQFIEPAGDFAPSRGQRICPWHGFVYRWPDPAHWFAEQAALKGEPRGIVGLPWRLTTCGSQV